MTEEECMSVLDKYFTQDDTLLGAEKLRSVSISSLNDRTPTLIQVCSKSSKTRQRIQKWLPLETNKFFLHWQTLRLLVPKRGSS